MNFLLFDENKARQIPTRDLICRILAHRYPKNMAEIHRELRSRYGIKISYQGVRKTINQLVMQGVLESVARKFQINRRWLRRTKSALDGLILRYDGGAVDTSTCESASAQYSSFLLPSLLALDNFWYRELQELITRAQDSNSRSIVCFVNYAWWMLLNFGQETKLYDDFKRLGFSMHVTFLKSNCLNRWAAQVYRDLGCKVTFRELRGVSDGADINILGDGVIQVEYPEQASVVLRALFKKYKSISTIPTAEISRLAHRKFDCRLITYDNAVLAGSLLDSYGKRA